MAALWLGAVLVLSAAPADQKLAIAHTAFAQSEDGPALAASYQFVSGETIFFSCLVEGYSRSDKDDVFLTYQIEARDARGLLLQPAASGKVQTTLAPEDRDWKPKFRDSIVVPPMVDPGEYQVLVKVKDERNGASTEARVPFHVQGREVAPSDTLVVRDFQFTRGEDDTQALKVPAYRPGDAVWARFLMTGYKIGGHNQLDIDYGLSVLRADGTVAYAQPHAAAEQRQPFYPQRYQPGVLSLNLAKDQKLGEYTIVLTVRDNLGHQTYETREKFSVE